MTEDRKNIFNEFMQEEYRDACECIINKLIDKGARLSCDKCGCEEYKLVPYGDKMFKDNPFSITYDSTKKTAEYHAYFSTYTSAIICKSCGYISIYTYDIDGE